VRAAVGARLLLLLPAAAAAIHRHRAQLLDVLVGDMLSVHQHLLVPLDTSGL
jgi:hypothetical protein